MNSEWDLDGVNYVFTQLVSNKKVVSGAASATTESDIEEGLFAGLKVDTDEKLGQQKFILVHKRDKKTVAFNADDYTIMTLDKVCSNVQKLIFFRCDKEDQEIAYGLLEETVEELTNQNRVKKGTTAIDVKSYDKLPSYFLNERKIIESATTHKKNYNAAQQHTGTPYRQHGQNYTHQPTTTYVDRTKDIRAFRRKTKKPTKKDLTKLREMLILMSTGEYEAPELPKFKCDEVEDMKYNADDYAYD